MSPKEAREALGLSRRELARRIGISSTALFYMETGKCGASRRVRDLVGKELSNQDLVWPRLPLVEEVERLKRESAALRECLRVRDLTIADLTGRIIEAGGGAP